MIGLLMTGLLLVSFDTVADTKVTYPLQDGEVIKVQELRKNSHGLDEAIDNIPDGPSGYSGVSAGLI